MPHSTKITSSPAQALIDKKGYLVLDGAMGSELEKRRVALDPFLWASRVLRDLPQAILDVHLDYLSAGADVMTTATYQLSLEGGRQAGLDENGVKALFSLAMELAREAIRRHDVIEDQKSTGHLVAASAGPYGAFLADGSEYEGQYDCTLQNMVDFHKNRLDIIADLKADIILFETIPSMREIQVISELIRAYADQDFWLSLQCRDGQYLADGTPLREVVTALQPINQWSVLGVNCLPPGLVGEVIETFKRAHWIKDIMVYPNAGERYDGTSKQWHGDIARDNLGPLAVSWAQQGARIIGGCCRTGPADIADISDALRDW